MSIRRRSREMALQLLYQLEVGKLESTPQNLLRDFIKDFEIDREVVDFGGPLFLGVCDHQSEIDQLIESNARHWKLSRMSLVDLSILRMACFEIKFPGPGVTAAIAMNEAIELAREFGSTDSASFVNGILDPIARHL